MKELKELIERLIKEQEDTAATLGLVLYVMGMIGTNQSLQAIHEPLRYGVNQFLDCGVQFKEDALARADVKEGEADVQD